MEPDDWLREDYRARMREIERREDLRQSLVNYSLIAVAGITAFLVSRYGEVGIWIPVLSLLSAILFLSLLVSYLRHDLFIAYNGQYILEYVLEPAKQKALFTYKRESWEEFLGKRRGKDYGGKWNAPFHLLLAVSRIGPIFLLSVVFFVGGVALPFLGKTDGALVKEPLALAFWSLFLLVCLIGFLFFL